MELSKPGSHAWDGGKRGQADNHHAHPHSLAHSLWGSLPTGGIGETISSLPLLVDGYFPPARSDCSLAWVYFSFRSTVSALRTALIASALSATSSSAVRFFRREALSTSPSFATSVATVVFLMFTRFEMNVSK